MMFVLGFIVGVVTGILLWTNALPLIKNRLARHNDDDPDDPNGQRRRAF